MLYRADYVIAGKGRVVADGAVRVEGNRVAAVGLASQMPPRPGEEVETLAGQVLSPGFINAHCHLDYSRMRGFQSGGSFSKWIQGINALKRSFSDDEYLEAIGLRLPAPHALRRHHRGQHRDLPRASVPAQAAPDPHLVVHRIERPDPQPLRRGLSGGDGRLLQTRQDWMGGFGLSPHAPYTASLDLYRLAKHCSERYGAPFTTHIAESREEHEMFPLRRRAALWT